ncbi:DsbA family oxidoreductase [Pedobacter immunditicola]|uniref:DsbA family oxidoreductase n=1 Tax=Pedobacter immunditicola TaxID=3133440 RepID=UPI0030A85B61
MKVDIWSDVRCPFCYIGKRKFEKALSQFEHKDKVEVEWHSYELDPNAKTEPDKNPHEHLAEIKGQTKQWAIEIGKYVSETAAETGITFDLDRQVVANSFNAHRLIQLAKSLGLGDEAEEGLFAAYFTAGKNIDDKQTLIEIGVSIGIDEDVVARMLESNSFTDEVRYDQSTAKSIGISGVPFFIINQKYSISGAQPPATFLDALKMSWLEYAPQED